ncbi:type II secretion system protein, partial [Candidatus Saccharibacteria bacterium]|nr:type II secretion system protein [Candidatus Saccharibacteria bacterium]
NNKKGFTLIEVVLVLAIGGLIFLLAFIAFQQVSANRRDTQRRSDAARLIAELENFRVDTGGYPSAPTVSFASESFAVPSTNGLGTFVGSYLGGSSYTNPDGDTYVFAKDAGDYAISIALGGKGRAIQYGYGQKCNNGSFVSNTGSVAIIMNLEKGNVCRDTLGN